MRALVVAVCLAATTTSDLAAQFFSYSAVVLPAANNPISSLISPYNTGAAVGYFDDDEYLDFAVNARNQSETFLFLNLGAAGPGFDGTAVPGFGGSRIFAADLNGDGFDDLLQITGSTINWKLNDGTASFPGTLGALALTNTVNGLAGIDVDGDGFEEVMVARRVGGSGGYYFHELYRWAPGGTGGEGVLTPVWNKTPADGTDPDGPYHVADLDNDGIPDIVSNWNEVLLNATPQTPGATPAFTTPTTTGTNRKSVAAGDLNGDGLVDLAFAYENTFSVEDVRTYLRDFTCSSGTFSLGSPTTWSAGNATGQAYWVDMGDLDGDDFADVVVGYHFGTFKVSVLRSNGSGELVDAQDLITGSGNQAAFAGAIADFDNDGDNDVLAFNNSDVILHVNELTSSGFEKITEKPFAPPTFLWVDQHSGNALENGSYGAPFKSLKAALLAATPGTAIMVQPGRYNACLDPAEQSVQPRTLSNVQLIGVAGFEKTFLYGMRFECDSGARISGFTMQAEGAAGEALIQASDATIIGNRLLSGSPMRAIYVPPTTQTTYIGSNIIHDFRVGVLVEGVNQIFHPSAQIHHNTIVECTTGIEFTKAAAITIRSNIVVDGSYGILHSCYQGVNTLTTLDVDYNWSANNSGGSGDYKTLVALGSACTEPFLLTPGPNALNGAFAQQSNFVDPAGMDYHLLATSAAIGAADPNRFAGLGIDVDGDPRQAFDLVGGSAATSLAPDVGADEMTSSELSSVVTLAGWDLTTEAGIPGALEIKVLSWQPSIFAVPQLSSVLLVDPYLQFATFPLNLSSPATNTMPRLPWIPVGARIYAQSFVIDSAANRFTLTNPVALAFY
ncbi:MAG: VCBS repeat-containing protein [Planctomycetes bacterium]|nr:VCBS repeat-containing protein [Planctomycetota bacterium]